MSRLGDSFPASCVASCGNPGVYHAPDPAFRTVAGIEDHHRRHHHCSAGPLHQSVSAKQRTLAPSVATSPKRRSIVGSGVEAGNKRCCISPTQRHRRKPGPNEFYSREQRRSVDSFQGIPADARMEISHAAIRCFGLPLPSFAPVACFLCKPPTRVGLSRRAPVPCDCHRRLAPAW